MAKWRREAFAVAMLFCALLVAVSCVPHQLAWAGYVQNTFGRALDVYAGKEPYSGKGPNQESDAYEPQEEVILYGFVTYNLDPVPDKIVTFDIRGPANSIENITTSLSNFTSKDGIATVRFMMSWPDSKPKAAIFGSWAVVATVDIAGVVATDTLTFKVGWLVELLDIRTADLNNVLKDTFWKGERMGFRLNVRNIGMTQKTATFTIVAFDELGFVLGEVRLESEAVPPGEKEYFVKEIIVPYSAAAGTGKAIANALRTVNGTVLTWCPQVETDFLIPVRDVAVLDAVASATEASLNQTVNIAAVVKNKGNLGESFNVSVFYDSTLIDTSWVENLAPNSEATLTFAWHLRNIQPGEYRIKAQAGPVPGETFLNDNIFVNGLVRISVGPEPPEPTILNVSWFLLILYILNILTATLLIFVLVLSPCRRRRKRRRAKAQPTTVEQSIDRKTCRACGREFRAVYTFCPHCLSFHGKDS